MKGNGGLTISGGGLTTLAAGNSYTGATNVSGGTLQLPAGTSGLSSAGWTVHNIQGGYTPTVGNNTVMLTPAAAASKTTCGATPPWPA